MAAYPLGLFSVPGRSLALLLASLISISLSPLMFQEKVAIPTDQRGGRVLELSLGDCLVLGTSNNLDLNLSRLRERVSRHDYEMVDSRYDFEFFLTGSWNKGETPKRSEFQPNITSWGYSANIGFRKQLLTGATLSLGFNPIFFNQEVQSIFAFPTEGYRGAVNFSLTQPLLKSAWSDYYQAELDISKDQVSIERYIVDRDTQVTLNQIVESYMALVFARENWRVKYFTLKLSRDQLAQTNKKIKLGQLAERDRITDEADLSQREEEIIVAETAILDEEDALKRLILPFKSSSDWEIIVQPTLVVGEQDPKYPIPQWKEAILIAKSRRPDMRAQERVVNQARLNLTRKDRDLLPQLDLTATVNTDAQRDTFGQFQQDIFGALFPDYGIRLDLVVPIGNRLARNAFERGKLELEQAQRAYRILEVDVERQVRQVLRNLWTLEKSTLAAKQSVRLAEDNLETETIKLGLGSSTAFEVQRRNTELSDARSRLLQARLDYRTSWFNLQAVLGQLGEDSDLPTTTEFLDGPKSGAKPAEEKE